MPRPIVHVGEGGVPLSELADSLLADSFGAGGRRVVGLAGCPGAGKSTLASALARALGRQAVVVPMDGFHLADSELDRQGLLGRKGAPETFDPWGYAALLGRLRGHPGHDVYAPGFDRALEQPIAGAIAVKAEAAVVIAEGNYLLVDQPEWQAVRAELDEVWYVCVDEGLRLERLVARHVESGKRPEAARDWVARIDEPNARLVEESRVYADRQVDVTTWVEMG